MSLLAIRLPEIIGLTILHSLWQITLLWIVLVAVLKLWPKASSAVRYTLAILTLMLSVLTTTTTAVYEWQSHATSEEVSALSNGTAQTMQTVYITVKHTVLSRIVDALNACLPILAWLWCAGLVVMGARFAGSFFYLRTLRAQENIAAIPPVWEQEFKRLSVTLGLRCDVAIATSTRISSPLALGSISPIILLPAGLLSGLSTTQIEAILVHELYHIKRRDYIINICQALVEVILFYHPAIWHINNIIREERENCCDDQTLAFCGDAITYARALTQIQEINTLTKPTLAMSVTGPKAGNFSNRIKRLFNIYPNPAQARSKGIFAIGFLIVYLSIVLASANVSTAQADEPEKKSMKTSGNEYNMFSKIFSDSTLVSEHRYVHDRKEVTSQPVAGKKKFWPKGFNTRSGDTSKEIIIPGLGVARRSVKLYAGGTPMNEVTDYVVDYTFGKITIVNDAILNSGKNIEVKYEQSDPFAFHNFRSIRSMDIQRADTTVKEQSLEGCLKQVSSILKMASLYRLPGERFQFSTFGAEDSLPILGSIEAFAKNNLKLQPARFYGTANRWRTTRLDSIDTTGNETTKEEAIKLKIQKATPLLLIDGTPISRSMNDIVLNQIEGSSIKSMTIYKGQQAIDLYGDDGKDGVIDVRLKPGTSIDEFTKGVAVQVFPNSTNGDLNINFTPARNNSRVKMVLLDSDGKAVKEITDSVYENIPTSLHVNVSSYKKGIYILQIDIDGAKSQQRVVVK